MKVLPGPGLAGLEFSWGRWGLYLLPQDMAAYRALRTAALTTQRLGWRPFAQAIGSPGHPVDKERLLPFYTFLAEYDFIDVPEWGKLIPRAVIVNPITDDPSSREVARLKLRELQREGPPPAVVDEFLDFFAQAYKRKTKYTHSSMKYHRRIAMHLLKTYSLDELKHFVVFYFRHMDGHHALGDFERRILLVVEEYTEEDARTEKYTPAQRAAIDAHEKAEAEFAAASVADDDGATLKRLGARVLACERRRKEAFEPPPPAPFEDGPLPGKRRAPDPPA